MGRSRTELVALTRSEDLAYPAVPHRPPWRAGLKLPRVLAAPLPGDFFSPPAPGRPERAIVFVDGSNWYHALKSAEVREISRIDLGRVSKKLVGSRTWSATRYYVGEVRLRSNPRLHAEQRRFLARLLRTDARISIHLGRLEARIVEGRAARELEDFISRRSTRLDPTLSEELLDLARVHLRQEVFVEKAVDVMLAVDLVVLADRDRFDVAYLLSTDGDFTPAVAAVRSSGRKVFAASPGRGVMLQAACDAFIRLPREWFDDCRI